jgi:hypothetical protein
LHGPPFIEAGNNLPRIRKHPPATMLLIPSRHDSFPQTWLMA